MYPNAPEDIITLEELCDILAIGKNTAYQLLKDHQLPPYRLGRYWKIPRHPLTDSIQKSSHID